MGGVLSAKEFAFNVWNQNNIRDFNSTANLAYGSWYDLQLVCRSKTEKADETETLVRYLVKGIYLRHGHTVKISELTAEKNLDLNAAWQCGSCKKSNVGNIAICEFCFTNKSQAVITVLSCIPVVGLPFQITDAVLQCGKAAQSNENADQVDAALSVTFAVVDIIATPFIVGALVEIPAQVAAKTGITLTVKSVFTEAGKPLLTAVGRELVKGGVITTVKLGKEGLREIVKNSIDHETMK